MKNVLKKALCLVLAGVLGVVMLACAASQDSAETTLPNYLRNPIPTQTTPPETEPLYTRPSDDEQSDPDEEIGSNPVEDSDDETGSSETASGSADSSSDNDTGDAFSDGNVTSNAAGVAKPLTWANINSFPIKSSSMSVAQMRELCVDFFRYAKTATWTPDESINYIKNAKGSKDQMIGGQLYGGLPYVGNSSGNIYRLMDYIDANGKVDMSDMLGSTSGELQTTDLRYFGNQCANGCAVGWKRVVNSVTKTHTAGITPKSGYVMLGDYGANNSKLNSISEWNTTYGTDEFCRANGEQVMFAAYAKLQMGDGLVYYTTAGHVIMAATDAHVEYIGATGVIDGEKSYITMIDQAQSWETQTAANGSSYLVKTSVDAKVSFNKLYSGNYVPFTFKEFTGADPVEETTISFSVTGASATFSQLCKGSVTSNYSITDAYIIVKDASGKEVYKHAVRNSSSWGTTLKMAASGAKVDSWGTLPTSGSYTFSIVAQLGTGERPTVYSGTLAF